MLSVSSPVFAAPIILHEGVYVSVPGPNLETPAEYKFLKIIGADAVGMSTVPEVIAAKHCGMDALAVSVITDLCYPEALKPVSIPEIIGAAKTGEDTDSMENLLKNIPLGEIINQLNSRKYKKNDMILTQS